MSVCKDLYVGSSGDLWKLLGLESHVMTVKNTVTIFTLIVYVLGALFISRTWHWSSWTKCPIPVFMGFTVPDWPANLHDLKPIGHLSDCVKRKIRGI